MLKIFLGCSVGVFAMVAFTGSANAQTAQPAAAAPVAAATPVPASGPPTTGANADSDEDKSNQVRFRWAVHIVGGPWLLPGKGGGAGGAGVQLGVQINDQIGVYYAGIGGVGAAYGAAGVFAYNSIMADYTLGNLFQVGLGPSADTFAFGSVSNSGSLAAAGTFFGVNGRVGLSVGSGGPGKHGRFMVGFEVHPTFISGFTPTTLFLTLGGGRF